MTETSGTGPVHSVKTDPDTTVNQPESGQSGTVWKRTESGHFPLSRVVQRKGSSHSGFFKIFFTLSGNRPFSRICPDLVIPGSGSGSKGSGSGSKGTRNPPYQALRTPGPLVQGDLDLSNTCPWIPWRGSSYRAQMTEDTGTAGGHPSSCSYSPGGNQAH